MAYATRADINAIYPNLLTRIAYNRGAAQDNIDEGVIDAALASASAEIDMFCSQRYSLPLAPVPAMVKQFCVDIAIYRICLTRDKLTNEMRTRYEDTIARLTMLAAGKIGIGNPAIDPTTNAPSQSGGKDANNSRAQICIMRRQG